MLWLIEVGHVVWDPQSDMSDIVGVGLLLVLYMGTCKRCRTLFIHPPKEKADRFRETLTGDCMVGGFCKYRNC